MKHNAPQPLSDIIELSPIHSKSVSLKYDFHQKQLKRLVVTDTLINLYKSIASCIATNQCAITVTGSYGVGKSFAMLLYGSILGDNRALKKTASEILGSDLAKNLYATSGRMKRKLVSIVGCRRPLHALLCDALIDNKVINQEVGSDKILEYLENYVEESQEGLLIILDEMGKVLECSASTEGSDLYFFQQLSELACRSNGKIVFIGILHQSMSLYFDSLGELSKIEWKKIQGRFHDITMMYPAMEQCQVTAGMITQKAPIPAQVQKAAKQVSLAHSKNGDFSNAISECHPLHPSTSVFLSHYIRSGVAQNRRSLASFVTGYEPLGLRYFVEKAYSGDLYTLDMLWDYINENISTSLVSSPYFHKWVHATEAISRTEKKCDVSLAVRIAKTIALHWLFGGSIAPASKTNLFNAFKGVQGITPKDIEEALSFLENESIIVFRKYLSAYVIFEGSDFNLDKFLDESADETCDLDDLTSILRPFSPLFARRHYLKTGTSRHLDICIYVSQDKIIKARSMHAFGLAVIDVSDGKDSCSAINKLYKFEYEEIIFTRVASGPQIKSLLLECQKIFKLIHDNPSIGQDKIAQREIKSRILINQQVLSQLLEGVIENSQWFDDNKKKIPSTNLRTIASELADKVFSACPKIINEMVNVPKVSGIAKRYVKILMANLKDRSDDKDFGYKTKGDSKFPLDKAIYYSVIKKLFNTNTDGVLVPKDAQLKTLWADTQTRIKKQKARISLIDIAEMWGAPPYGLNGGVMPLFLWLFYLHQEKNISLYEHGLYKTHMTETDINSFFLMKNYEFFWVDGTKSSGLMFETLKTHFTDQDADNLSISRKLVARLDKLPHWTQHTKTLGETATKLRNYLKRAKDPNEVILRKLPNIYKGCPPQKIIDDIQELEKAQDNLLNQYQLDIMYRLGCDNWATLQKRMSRLLGHTQHMRFERFISLLNEKESIKCMSNIVSLLANNPLSNWTDGDKFQADNDLKQFTDMLVMMDSNWGYENYSAKHKDRIIETKDNILSLISKISDKDAQIALSAISLVNAELRKVNS